LIYRVEKLQEYFLNPEESFDLFDIQNMLSDQYITKEFCTIMNYPFGDIQKGKTIVDGILVEIPIYERMIWFWLMKVNLLILSHLISKDMLN